MRKFPFLPAHLPVRFYRIWCALLVVIGLAATLMPMAQAHAQSASLSAEIIKIDLVQNKVTLKAVMGHGTLRVQKPELLEGFKVGDQVLFEVGQDGTEVVITVLTKVKK